MYCPNCAGVIEPNQTACPRCGRALEAAQRPSSVNSAVILLVVALAFGLVSIAIIFADRGGILLARPSYLLQTAVIFLVWIGLIILLLKRQGWARIGVLMLTGYAIFNLALTFLRIHNLPWSFAIPVADALIRLIAGYLLFRSESNRWYTDKSVYVPGNPSSGV